MAKPTYSWVTTERMKRERQSGVSVGSKPSNIRIYDNGGETADRFTIVNTRPFVVRGVRYYHYAGSSEDPYHPQGVGQSGESRLHPYTKQRGETTPRWEDLPPNVRKFALAIAKW